MKHTIHVSVTEAICPVNHTVYYHELSIPAWQFQLTLLDAERDYIKAHTLSVFLKQLLRDLLAERDAKGFAIEPTRKLTKVLHELFAPAPPINAINHPRLHLSIDIEGYQPLRIRWRFFERFTPLFVGICSSIDIVLISVLNFCSMQYAQGSSGFLNMGYDSNFGISLSSSLIGIFWALWGFFSSGEIVFLKDTGAMIDKKCQQLYDWSQGRNPTDELVRQNTAVIPLNGVVLKTLLKSLFTLAFMNDLYQQITSSYTQIVSMSTTISKTISLPANFFRILQWCELSFSHIDDPFIWITMFYFGFSVIDVLIQSRFPEIPLELQAIAAPIIHDSQPPDSSAPRDERRLSRLERWSQGTDPRRYQLLTAADVEREAESKPASVIESNMDSLPSFNRH